MPCPCSTVAIASWEIRLRFALCPPSLSCLRRIRVSLSSSGDGTRVNSKGGQNSEGDFRRREGVEPPVRRKGVARGSIRKYQTGNCSADCLSACGYFRADSWWRMDFLFLFYLFIFYLARADCRVFSELNWEQIGDGERLKFLIWRSRESVWKEVNKLIDDHKKWWYCERENFK